MPETLPLRDFAMEQEHRHKRAKLLDEDTNAIESLLQRSSRRSISPPGKRVASRSVSASTTNSSLLTSSGTPSLAFSSLPPLADSGTMPVSHSRMIPSPIQLNTIAALPASSNVDTVSLRDILGDPLISECWLFNYLFDVDFIL